MHARTLDTYRVMSPRELIECAREYRFRGRDDLEDILIALTERLEDQLTYEQAAERASGENYEPVTAEGESRDEGAYRW